MIKQTDLQRRIFDKEFKRYRSYSLPSWRKCYLKRIFRELDLESSDKFLDIGVGGSGYTVIEASRLCSYSCGIDISGEGIKKAKLFAESLNINNANFMVSSAEDLPFKDCSFNKVCSIAVLEHVEEDKKAIDEINRVLSVGGKIHICVPNSYYRMPLTLGVMNLLNDKKVGHIRHYYHQDLINEFEKRGFHLDSLEFHAHSIKILSYCLGFLPLPFKDKPLLYFENIDQAQKNDPRSMNFSITMTKIKG